MENELRHHGVKGMKWGVRRYQNKDGSYTPAGRKRRTQSADNEARVDRKNALKNRRTLSDKELKERVERLKLEKQFKELTEEDISPGRAFVSDVMKTSGSKVAKAVVTGAALYGIKTAMTGKFDISEAASYMTPKPKNK